MRFKKISLLIVILSTFVSVAFSYNYDIDLPYSYSCDEPSSLKIDNYAKLQASRLLAFDVSENFCKIKKIYPLQEFYSKTFDYKLYESLDNDRMRLSNDKTLIKRNFYLGEMVNSQDQILSMPFSLQKSLDNHYKTGCVLKSDFLFERSIVGHHKYEYNGWVFDNPPKYLGCYSGSRGGAIGILVNYLIFFIGLNYIVPWIARMFSSAGKIYKSSAKEAKVNTEKNYLIAYKEVESGKLKSPELWAKAFAETEGDEVKQKALYVELRTKQLDEMK